MPRFSLPEFSPEVTSAMSHEPSLASGEGAVARGSQIHPGAGGITPVSVAPATFGLGTAPLRVSPIMRHLYEGETFTPVNIAGAGGYYVRSRKTTTDLLKGTTELYTPPTAQLYQFDPKQDRYIETGLRAHSVGGPNWELDDAPATHATSAASRPGSSRAASSQTIPWAKENVLEKVLSMAENYVAGVNFSFRNKHEWLFHTFDGEKLPKSKGHDTLIPGHDSDNRLDVEARITKLLQERGYQVAKHGRGDFDLHLDVTNPEHTGAAHPGMPEKFSVYVRLSSRGVVAPPIEAPRDQPYLLAVVDFNARDGMLKTVHLIPVKHEQRQRPVQPKSADQASDYFRPWMS
jgi:hypothetical protein